MTGEGEGKEGTFRAITRLETLATQAIIDKSGCPEEFETFLKILRSCFSEIIHTYRLRRIFLLLLYYCIKEKS